MKKPKAQPISSGMKLVPLEVSRETVEALKYLLKEAESGELVGVTYAAMFRRRYVSVDSTGEASRNPIFSLGVISMLRADMEERAREQGEQNR